MIRAFGTIDEAFMRATRMYISPLARKDSHMEPYQYFIMPIMDDKAQVAIIALIKWT